MDAEIRLLVVDGRAPDMEGCTNGASEPLPARGTSFGRAALSRALADRPLPNGTEITDFVSPGWTDDNRTERVDVLLSADRVILPRELPGLTADEICARMPADVELPTQMLNFKIIRFDGNTNIYVQRIDIETARITEQHEVISRGDDEDHVAAGLARALAILRTAPGAFATDR